MRAIERSALGTAAALLAIAAGCASVPDVHYYTLDMTPSGTVDPPVVIAVEGLRVADPLARRQIMIQMTPTRIEYYALDEWAGSLSELVARKLEAELGGGAAVRPAVVLSGTVLECGQVDVPGGAHGLLELRATLRAAGARAVEASPFETTYRCAEPAESPSPGAVAMALSRCAERIASDIAVDAARVAETEGR